MRNMRKILLSLAAMLVLAGVTCEASTLRFNYKAGGITHISADYELITPEGSDPFWTRIEFVGFPECFARFHHTGVFLVAEAERRARKNECQ